MTSDQLHRHRTCRFGPFWAASSRGIGFFRVFGWGLHWKDNRRHRPLWSERERIFVQCRVGSWTLTPLKRGNRGFRRNRDV